MGETILIKGKSGAGKSTFYDILNGSISKKDYSAQITIDNEERTFHSIEKCRTMVLQDTSVDYRSSLYTIITDQDDDHRTDIDSILWTFFRLVQIDDLIEKDFKGNLHQPIESKLSGGQKTRLLLARALYRAQQRNCSLLILDEPDKGLPAETTVSIIQNIIKWYQSKGILFLTLHTEQAHQLNFDQILHIEQGTITKIK
jgi:ABC-type transport system involved in cytochrome bd biosynthesis fused ATPase/permease subunit